MIEEKSNLLAHLKELKNRLVLCVAFFLLSFALCYYFVENIYEFLLNPLAKQLKYGDKKLIYTGLTEVFFSYLKLSFYSALMMSIPFVFIQLYLFISPGLYKNEKSAIKPFVFFTPLLFLLGAAFVYYMVFPFAWNFFLNFQNTNLSGVEFQLEARVSEYLNLCLNLIIAFGMAFQLPIILLFLKKIGVITSEDLIKNRKYAIVFIFIMAAILTPPDAITQIALAIPMMILYELSVFLSKKI